MISVIDDNEITLKKANTLLIAFLNQNAVIDFTDHFSFHRPSVSSGPRVSNSRRVKP
jgi:hypothetical protein